MTTARTNPESWSPRQALSLAVGDLEEEWPILRDALRTLCRQQTAQTPSISYERCYTACYKCCHGHAEQVYKRICSEIEGQLSGEMENLQMEDGAEFLELYLEIWRQFQKALPAVVSICKYLNQVYLEPKLNKDLRSELLEIFAKVVIDSHTSKLLHVLTNQKTTSSHSYQVVSVVAQSIWTARPSLLAARPQVLARFLPNNLPKSISNPTRGSEMVDEPIEVNGNELVPPDPDPTFHPQRADLRGVKRCHEVEEDQGPEKVPHLDSEPADPRDSPSHIDFSTALDLSD